MAYSRYYRQAMTPEERLVYDALAEGLARMDAQIPLPAVKRTNPTRYTQAVQLDYPELFFVDFAHIQFLFAPQNSRAIPAYRLSADQAQRQAEDIRRVADKIVRRCAGRTLPEAERILHDALIELGVYGKVAGREHDAHSIYGAFVDRRCVCEGYAKAFKYLCDRARLQCLVVGGRASPPGREPGAHAWNMVNLDGRIYHVDVTFDRMIEGQHHSLAYYNLSDAEIRLDHASSESMYRLPPTPESGAVLPLIGGTLPLIDFLRGEYARHSRYSEVRLTRGFAPDELLSMILKRLQPGDYGWYNAIKSCYYGTGARSFFIVWK